MPSCPIGRQCFPWRVGVAALAITASTWTLAAQQSVDPAAALQSGDSLMSDQKYVEALRAYQQARQTQDPHLRVRAGIGSVRSLLRMGRFADAKREAVEVVEADPKDPAALAEYGDSLWASGLFLEAEDRYTAALTIDPNDPGALHGRGRSLAAQHKLTEALADVAQAATADPREPGYVYTLATIDEQLHRYDDSAAALERYVKLLPHGDKTDLAKWARAQIHFLRSFKKRVPFEFVGDADSYTVPFRLDKGRMVVTGHVNGGAPFEFVVDTGADQTAISPGIANSNRVESVATQQAAGVGSLGVGFRGLQVARLDELAIGDLRVRNVTCYIKSPSLKDAPAPDSESFSPLALGLSMSIDYQRRVLTLARHLPDEPSEKRLPLRVQRLAMVRGVVNGSSPASFVVDTAGDVTALSRSVAGGLDVDPNLRLVPVRIYGISGWDSRAFLLPFVDIDLGDGVGLRRTSVVVLNLDAPSGLLGFNLGGIIGHEFLSRYKVSIDLERSEVRLQPADAS